MPNERSPWAKWERTRSKGREYFIWVYGVFGFGVTFGIAMASISVIVCLERHHPAPWVGPIFSVFISPVGGYAWGYLVWEATEAKYLAARGAEQAALEQKTALEALAREVQELRNELGR